MGSRPTGRAARVCFKIVLALVAVMAPSGVTAQLLNTRKNIIEIGQPTRPRPVAKKVDAVALVLSVTRPLSEWNVWSDSSSGTITAKGEPSGGAYTWTPVDYSPMTHEPAIATPAAATTVVTMPKGPGEYRLKVTYVVGGKETNLIQTVPTKYVGARFMEDPAQKYGFDDNENPPWVSVKSSDDTTVRLEVYPESAAAKIRIVTTAVSATPVVPTAAPQVVKITVGAAADHDPGKIVKAHYGTDTGPICKWKETTGSGEAKVRVASFAMAAGLSVYVHKTLGASCDANVVANANKIFKQAVMQVGDAGSHDCTGYIYPNAPTTGIDNDDEATNLYWTCNNPAAQDIYVLRAGSSADPTGGRSAIHKSWDPPPPPPINYTTNNPSAALVAHELFHNYQYDPDHDTTDADNLMQATFSGTHLRYYQWKKAHGL
ncbi:MAG: hypothetical protein WCN95_11305 [bacterium]